MKDFGKEIQRAQHLESLGVDRNTVLQLQALDNLCKIRFAQF